MKVLFVTNNFPTEHHPVFGIFVKEQMGSLSDLGVNTEVLFMNSREQGKIAYLKGLFRLIKHLNRNKYDIVHCHHSYSAVIFVASGKFFRQKCLLSYQNDPENEGGMILFRILYAFFDMIIFKNKSSQLYRSKTAYLPNGVNTDFFVPRDKTFCKRHLGLDEKKRYIIFMDSYNLRTQKRVDRFNEVIRILREKYGLADIEPIILTNTERNLIPYYFCASELHLVTSDFEGSPNSVKECIACNTPVVSTPVGNVADMIGDIKGCNVSTTFEPEELAELANRTLSSDGYSSREFIEIKGLGINTVGQKLLDIYSKILAQ